MEQALDSTPETDFPEARSEPVWHTFTRGQYAGEVYEPPAYTAPTESTTTKKQRETTAATATAATGTAAPAATGTRTAAPAATA